MTDTKQRPDNAELEALWKQGHKNSEDIAELRTLSAKLEVGQASLSDQMKREFESLDDAIRGSIKPPVNQIALFSLVVVVLGGFGTIITYMNGQTSEAMKRENDLRFEAVATKETIAAKALSMDINHVRESIQDIYLRMQVDDKREQKDMYDKGVMEARFKGLEQNFYHLDDQLHIRHRRDEDTFRELKERVGQLEKTESWGRGLRE